MDSINSIAVKTHLEFPTIGRTDPDEIIKPLQATILMIAQRLGIKISTIEVQDLSRFICQYFKDFNIEEIPIAFDLLNARKFEIKSGGHFGILGQAYFGEVLTEYRKFRNEETRKENIKKGSIDGAQSRILTPDEEKAKNLNAMRVGVLSSFDYFVANNKMEREPSNDLVSALHYDYLRLLNVIETPDDDLKKEIKEEAHQYLKDQNKLSQYNSNRTELKNLLKESKTLNGSDKHKTTCKKIAVRCFFEGLMLDGTELKELLTKTTT